MLTLLDTSSVIGIIVAIALVSANIAVILYIYQRKSKEDPSEDEHE